MNSFTRLWAVQIMAHSARTFSTPRNRNWRKPRACLICPNTGSTNSDRAWCRGEICLAAAFAGLLEI